MKKTLVSAGNQSEVRTLKEIFDKIPQQSFLKKGKMIDVLEFKKSQKVLVLFKTFTDYTTPGPNITFKAGTLFMTTGRARCLKPDPEKETSQVAEIEAQHMQNKTLHWIPCSIMTIVNASTNVTEEVTDAIKTPPVSGAKDKNHPRHMGARHHINAHAAPAR